MLQAAHAAGVTRVIHASTIGVYGSASDGPVGEDAPLSPENRYGRTKLEGEQVVTEWSERVPVIVLRISETYGPGDWRLLKLFKALKRHRFVHIGAERNLHHPIYIDDLVLAMERAATQPVPRGGGFVVAGPRPVTTQDMIDTICRALGEPSPRWRVPLRPIELTAAAMEAVLPPLNIAPALHRRRLDFFIKSFHFDGTGARSALGYLPLIDFAEGARRTAEWYQAMHLL